jgi:hypothetical protein
MALTNGTRKSGQEPWINRSRIEPGLFMNAVAKRLRPKPREGNQVKAEVKIERDFLDLSLNLNLIPERRGRREDRPL